jgi:hypothetical protein
VEAGGGRVGRGVKAGGAAGGGVVAGAAASGNSRRGQARRVERPEHRRDDIVVHGKLPFLVLNNENGAGKRPEHPLESAITHARRGYPQPA